MQFPHKFVDLTRLFLFDFSFADLFLLKDVIPERLPVCLFRGFHRGELPDLVIRSLPHKFRDRLPAPALFLEKIGHIPFRQMGTGDDFDPRRRSVQILCHDLRMLPADLVVVRNNNDLFPLEIFGKLRSPLFGTAGVRRCGNPDRPESFHIFFPFDNHAPVRLINHLPVVRNRRNVGDPPMLRGPLNKLLFLLRMFHAIYRIDQLPGKINVIVFSLDGISLSDQLIIPVPCVGRNFSQFDLFQPKPVAEELLRLLNRVGIRPAEFCGRGKFDQSSSVILRMIEPFFRVNGDRTGICSVPPDGRAPSVGDFGAQDFFGEFDARSPLPDLFEIVVFHFKPPVL